MAAPSQHLEIYTIGHGNASSETILELLHRYNIQTLVDVRSVPFSQYTPAFNREVFNSVLEQAGIDYTFAGEYLGGRPKDETCYVTSEVPDKDTKRNKYLKLVDYNEVAKRDWYLKGIKRLLQIASERRTAIMCSEENPEECHRSHLIAQTLLSQDITVTHIRKDGTLEHEILKAQQLRLL